MPPRAQGGRRGGEGRRRRRGERRHPRRRGGGGRRRPPRPAQEFALWRRLARRPESPPRGPRRVDSWRLSRSLEEVAWVFSTLCATIPAAKVDAGLPAWRGDECATFVANLGLGQYAPSFAFNLNGARLPSLRMTELNQLGVCAFEHQKKIMEGVRHLTAAFERKERAAKANAAWADLLSGNATAAAPAPGEEEEEGADAGASTAERRPRPGSMCVRW